MAHDPRPTSLTKAQRDALLDTMEARFRKHEERHPGVEWDDVRSRLEANPQKLRTLREMERTGGEPDVVAQDPESGAYLFYDCSPESPAGRRSLCYDEAALEARRKNKPEGSAVGMASEMGAALLTETEYRRLQELGPFDTKTSSWLATPPEIRKLGGAVFGDYRYGTVFMYHNGAESYYAARGFRCVVRV
jgi:hypothetical protein